MHGTPASHSQPPGIFSDHGRSGCASHTQPTSWQVEHFSIAVWSLAVSYLFCASYTGAMASATFRERYPPPWSVEEMPGGFKVVSSNGFTLVYVYSVDGIARSASPNTLSSPEALVIARAICGLADVAP